MISSFTVVDKLPWAVDFILKIPVTSIDLILKIPVASISFFLVLGLLSIAVKLAEEPAIKEEPLVILILAVSWTLKTQDFFIIVLVLLGIAGYILDLKSLKNQVVIGLKAPRSINCFRACGASKSAGLVVLFLLVFTVFPTI